MDRPVLIRTVDALQRCVAAWHDAGDRVGLVPTMGALHQGHLQLVDAARAGSDRVIVSVFVNPTQFAPGEDFAWYPRTLEQDLDLLRGHGADVVFAPADDEIYPPGFATFVDPPPLARQLEGVFRPTHFRGVATVVLKLLNICRADRAWFGQKDFQQLRVIQQMAADLNHPCAIEMVPTVREADGLALSSRNRYLSPEERVQALALSRALRQAAAAIADGERDGHALMAEMTQMMIDGGVSQVDYAVVADPRTLELMTEVRLPAVLLVAARVGSTRLIDNWLAE